MADRAPNTRYTNSRKIRVDREKTCPFLLRAFVKIGTHHRDDEFTLDKVPTIDEHQLYTWKDSTLRELILLIRDASPNLRLHPHGRYSLKLVYYDTPRAAYVSRELATLSVRDVVQRTSTNRAVEKTLDEVRFVVGDFLDVAYFIPVPAAAAAGTLASSVHIRGGGPGDRHAGGRGPGEKRAAEAWGVPALNTAPGGAGGWGRTRPTGASGPAPGGTDTWAPRSGGRGAPPADSGWNGPKFAPNNHTARDGPPHQQRGGDRRPTRRSSRSRSPPPRRRDSRASPGPPADRRGSGAAGSGDDMRD